jgi:GNAT superfamily N-acetyltransferase
MTSYHRIIIRALKKTDLDLVAKLWFESWQSTGMEFTRRHEEPAFHRQIRQRFDGWQAYVACRGTDPVGFLALAMEDARVDQLFIAPQHQRQGVGKLLLNFAKQKLPNGFWLRALVDNRGACAFYDTQRLPRVRTELNSKLGIPMVIYGWQPVETEKAVRDRQIDLKSEHCIISHPAVWP